MILALNPVLGSEKPQPVSPPAKATQTEPECRMEPGPNPGPKPSNPTSKTEDPHCLSKSHRTIKNPDEREDGPESEYGALAGNPAAVNLFNGTGKLGEFLGIKPETGVQLGGLWISNTALILGGQNQGDATYNNLAIADLQVDLETFMGVDGASFAATFLQFDGARTNSREGVAVGFDGITESGPLNRSELYQLWWRQKFFDDTLIFRIGKSIPYVDFGNVIKALPIDREHSPPKVPAVTALIFAPIFVNPTMLGVMPGYYNSAWGATATYVPNDYYASLGFFDGSLARGRQTGIFAGPSFNAYYFSIGEIGKVWGGNYPGKIAFGGWGQSGNFCEALSAHQDCQANSTEQSGIQGFYALATNRLLSVDWAGRPGAFVGYLQYGINNAKTLMANQFVGGGVSGFGVIPERDRDSFGFGFGLTYLNTLAMETQEDHRTRLYPNHTRTNELVTQMYYQAHLFGDVYLQPVLSYVPRPALSYVPLAPLSSSANASRTYPASTSAVIELIALF